MESYPKRRFSWKVLFFEWLLPIGILYDLSTKVAFWFPFKIVFAIILFIMYTALLDDYRVEEAEKAFELDRHFS